MSVTKIFPLLEQNHALTMLEQLSNYNHFQQLIATLLSSRTKDSTTIPIVKKLFVKLFKEAFLFQLVQSNGEVIHENAHSECSSRDHE